MRVACLCSGTWLHLRSRVLQLAMALRQTDRTDEATQARFKEPADAYAALPIARTSDDQVDVEMDDPLTRLTRAIPVVRGVCKKFLGDEDPVVLEPGYDPPPRLTADRSCVYVLEMGGLLYVGETDALENRLRIHRQTHGDGLTVVVFPLVKAGKSRARQLETKAIKALQKKGFPMLAQGDGTHTHFGVT